MAEGWTRHLRGDVIEAYSAGVETHGLNPLAVRVMAEAGVDISGHASKLVDDLPQGVAFDFVITVCDNAREACPFFPAASRVLHVGFDDPPALARELAAKGAPDEEAVLAVYRRVRDEIRAYVLTLPDSLLSA
jgi:arsenate reductase